MIEMKTDVNKVHRRFDRADVDFRRGCMDGLRKSGQIVRERIRWLIKNPPKTGIKYPNLPNRSSAGGEAPAYQFGNLWKGVKYVVHRWDLMEVGDTVRYGGFLEYGTSRMKPRPHISTAVTQTFNSVRVAIEMMVNRRMSER